MELKSMGQRIKMARESKGYTQEVLAEKLNLSVQHVSVIERGVKSPRMETFVNIANELEVSADYLLGETLYISEQVTSNYLYERIGDMPRGKQRKILNILETILDNFE